MLAHSLTSRLVGEPPVAAAHVVDDVTNLARFRNDTGHGRI
jgi:hypothetical protein